MQGTRYLPDQYTRNIQLYMFHENRNQELKPKIVKSGAQRIYCSDFSNGNLLRAAYVMKWRDLGGEHIGVPERGFLSKNG